MHAAQKTCSQVAGVPISCCLNVNRQMGHFSSNSLLLLSELKPGSASSVDGCSLPDAVFTEDFSFSGSGSVSSPLDSTFFRLLDRC